MYFSIASITAVNAKRSNFGAMEGLSAEGDYVMDDAEADGVLDTYRLGLGSPGEKLVAAHASPKARE